MTVPGLILLASLARAGADPAALAQRWLHGPVEVTILNEATKARGHASFAPQGRAGAALGPEGVVASVGPLGDEWTLRLAGGPRTGHAVTIELPLLAPERLVFTPSERGVMALDANPSYAPPPYGAYGWTTGAYYVLPLVAVLDPAADAGLTLALPPGEPIPHFQIAWRDARVLSLTIAHLGLGVERMLRICLFAHAADYRGALGAYAARFPRYFAPGLPRGEFEGSFWYHHIHDHPEFGELSAQNVKYVWTSFWFTHLGEYLPDASEWEPYTYAKWWALGQTMSDAKIRAFARAMRERGIATYAYFNVTEYGGMGGKTGDAEAAARALREKFAGALVENERGEPIPTWEGAMAMNPRRDGALFPFLVEQARRHLARLPEIDGFVIDRLDWASTYDYGRGDGITMLGDRPVTNMAAPVAEAVREVCRLSHAAGKRVLVNQFWRVEMLADVDGYCHEYDFVRGLGYLAPFRPAAAWNHAVPYRGDLLPFEAQLKRRLQFAVFPQMIARAFPISQQAPDPEAAAMLELFAPLFAPLTGKEQVLAPHCIAATGANDVNLFVNAAGRFVVPLTSRIRFLARGARGREEVEVAIRAQGADAIEWAHVYSVDAAPARASVTRREGATLVRMARHGTSSVIVAGKNPEPAPGASDEVSCEAVRHRLAQPGAARSVPLPEGAWSAALGVVGTHVGERGVVRVIVDGAPAGGLAGAAGAFPVARGGVDPAAPLPDVVLAAGDEGTWFVPEGIHLLVRTPEGKVMRVAEWTPAMRVEAAGAFGAHRFALARIAAEEVIPPRARFAARDSARGGQWRGAFGTRAAWIPRVTAEGPAGGFALGVTGESFLWPEPEPEGDARVLEADGGAAPRATCWFAKERLGFALTPPDGKDYCVAVYILDYDRNGRAVEALVRGAGGAMLDRRNVAADDTARGVYLRWIASGRIEIVLEKTAGFNAVASGVFIDPAGLSGDSH